MSVSVHQGSTNRPVRGRRRTLARQRAVSGWLMTLPALAFVALFTFYPLMRGFWVSLHRWDGISVDMRWVGLRNYVNVFNDQIYWAALGHTFQYAIGVTVVKNVLALLLAVLLNRQLVGRGFFRVATFLPVVMSFVVVGILWSWIFNPTFGLLNQALHAVGLDGLIHGWLSDPAVALWSVMSVDVWKWTGFHVVLILAGLQAIPGELDEAAALDGAGRFRIFWSITLPLLRPVLTFSVLMSVVGAFVSNYDLVKVMTGGGPSHATEVALTWIVNTTFTELNVGKANAMSFILFFIVIIVGALQLRLMTRRAEGQR
ncbi:MAG: carbohydrate ABC transporter permease [Propioniciclava sp.]